MRIDWNTVRIFIKPGITDMRKQINGLTIITEEEMKKDPLSGHLFMFCSRNRKLLKVVYWDRNGFCLWMKRLEKHHFPWPNSEEEAREITEQQLTMLLSGIDFFNAHTTLNFSEAS
ncbi:MAG: IS66 family insertion sequence element accessory protein TnpB [Spirochaetes bacterium]|nr:IS66 family insertion sequence element accessory protein TnpB [Spirochaetota bacterium]MBN2770847.1 IS66 family insertion sequence element accessory protein TnpB [Spirochaetota bacterium]